MPDPGRCDRLDKLRKTQWTGTLGVNNAVVLGRLTWRENS
jgi:hypothetical protein